MTKPYTYVVARIRALEARMLTPAQATRMIEAPDLERAFFILTETSYADHISAAVHPFDFKEIIEAELRRTYDFLKYYAGGDEALKILWRVHDYGNAKVLIRALKQKREDVRDNLTDFGVVDKAELAAYILKGEGSIPAWLEKAVGQALLALEEEGNPAAIDKALDQAFIRDMAGRGNRMLRRLASLWSESAHPFDLAGDNRTIGMLQAVKRRAFGIEPLITYWMAKILEAETIGEILVGKKHHVRPELIKERERVIYV